MNSQKKQDLCLVDIVVLALIFFGQATFSSTMMLLDLQQAGLAAPEHMNFSEAENLSTIVFELASLAVAALYLRWRKFDFGVLNFSVNRWTLPLTVLLIASAGLTADALDYLHQLFWADSGAGMARMALPAGADAAGAAAGMEDAGRPFTPLLLPVCLLNGFYEEVFFMGLVFAVRRNRLPHAIALSLLVRFAFHTYQGLVSAVIITSLGPVFLLFRRHIRSLVPFVLAHAVFDIFGLSLLRIFWW